MAGALKRRTVLIVLLALMSVGLVLSSDKAMAGDGSSKASAIEITGIPFSANSTPSSQIAEVVPSCQASARYGARWFRLDTTEAVEVAIDMRVTNPHYDAYAALFQETGGELVQKRCGEVVDESTVSYKEGTLRWRETLAAASTYYILFTTMSASSTHGFTLEISRFAPPAHDDLASAQPLASLPSQLRVSFDAATLEEGEELPSCAKPGERSVWYRVDLAGREGVEIDTNEEGAIAVRTATGREVECVRTPQPHYYPPQPSHSGEIARLRPSRPGQFFVQVTSTRLATVTFTYRTPPTNDDLAHAIILREPDALAAKPLPAFSVQDAVMSSLEPGEPASGETVGSLWWIYSPDHHSFVSARAADSVEPRIYYDGSTTSWWDFSVWANNCCPWVNIRVFERVNGQLGSEVALDRTLSTNGTVRWLAEGGRQYAIQFSFTELRLATLVLSLNPQGTLGMCNYNACVL